MFFYFCLLFGLLNPDNSILPASDITILRFISYLSLSFQPSTVKSYLSAVRSLHVMMGLDNPFCQSPQSSVSARGIKRLQGNNRRLRRPITPELWLLFVISWTFPVMSSLYSLFPHLSPIAHKGFEI